MSNLILDSLEIQNFRAFRHLKIEKLGRVNLIVGKNSVGKTSLLEAVYIYAHRGSPSNIWKTLEDREEGEYIFGNTEISYDELISSLKYLFFGREDIKFVERPKSIRISPVDRKSEALSIEIVWYLDLFNQEGKLVEHRRLFSEEDEGSGLGTPYFEIKYGMSKPESFEVEPQLNSRWSRGYSRQLRCIFTPSSGFKNQTIANFWDDITLTELEKEVISALQTIAPSLKGINFIGDQNTNRGRFPVAKIDALNTPIPLRSLGDGMNRIFGIAVALVNAKDGLLLIDEFENCLHYSVQYDLWKLIFQVARRLNVQVFATTHSWDCIEAFTKAAVEDKKAEGMLIRLQNNEGDIVPTLFDERRLSIATRDQIEVR